MMRSLIFMLPVLLLAGCRDATAPLPDERDESDLGFVQLSASAQLAATQASMWAVRGQTRTLQLLYADAAAGEDALLEFTVGPLALLTRLDGTPLLIGDSVQITITLDVQRRLRFDFQPAGLVFSPLNPAVLRLSYARADADLNRDGVVDALDTALELQLRVWRQDAPGLPWLPVPTLRFTTQKRVEATILHFTGFALAS